MQIAGRRNMLRAAAGGRPAAPGSTAAAISIKRRVKEARMRSSSARRLQISEFMSKKFIASIPYSCARHETSPGGPSADHFRFTSDNCAVDGYQDAELGSPVLLSRRCAKFIRLQAGHFVG